MAVVGARITRARGVFAAAAAAVLASSAEARLGEGETVQAASTATGGYRFTATTTSYRPLSGLSCGGIGAEELVAGTDYIVVASAQAMQGTFWTPYGGCSWSCTDASGAPVESCKFSKCASNGGFGDGAPDGDGECRCRQNGSCWCGSTGEVSAQAISGTAQLGCFTCARGRFMKRRPYGDSADVEGFASEEVRVIVADVCPHGSNPKWCPGKPGDENVCGEKNHLDFDLSKLPAGVDNNYFVFEPEPCAEELRSRVDSKRACVKPAWYP